MEQRDNLWTRAPAWRWLISTAALATVLIVLAKPWQGPDDHTAAPATFDPMYVASSPPSSPNQSSQNISRTDPSQTIEANGAIRDVSPTATPTGSTGYLPPTPSSIVWNNAMGSVTGRGLIAGYCCAGASADVFANTSVRSGKHYWELTLSVRPGADNPDTYTNAGITTDSANAVSSDRMRAALPQGVGRPADRASIVAIRWGQSKRYRNGDVMMFALDADSGVAFYGVNGQWLSGEPTTATGEPIGTPGASFTPYVTLSASSAKKTPEGDRWIANFGGVAFKFPIPSGYRAYGASGAAQPVVAKPASPSLSSNGNSDPSSPSLINKTFQNVISVAGQTVSLPEGAWLGLAFFRGSPGSGQGDTAVLGRIEKNRLVQMVAINAFKHTGATKAGFPSFPACDRQDYVFAEKKSNEAFGEQHCWWINHAVSIWQQQSVFRAAQGVIAEHGVTTPQVFMNVGFRRADELGFVTAFYYFDPAEDGIQSATTSWRESEWVKDKISTDPKRVEYVKKLREWGRSWAPIVFATQ